MSSKRSLLSRMYYGCKLLCLMVCFHCTFVLMLVGEWLYFMASLMPLVQVYQIITKDPDA